jgi:signal transduction histidine kinase
MMSQPLSSERSEGDLSHVLGFFDGVFAGSRDAAIAFDRELRLVRMNATAESMTRLSAQAVLGTSVLELFPTLAVQPERACFEQVLRGLYAQSELSVWSGKPTHYTPLHAGDGAVVGGVAVAKVDDDLQQALESMTRTNAELERFAYVAAHDLQEPVRMVASYTRLIAGTLGPSLDEPSRGYLAHALDGALRMRALIDGLLAVARVPSLGAASQPCLSLDEVVSEALCLLSLAVEESAAKVTTCALPSVPGTRVLLVQLFQNLLENALKFRGTEPPHITIGYEASGPQEWLFHVQDNGIGMPMEHAERAFHLLQRVHSRKRYPGSGLGLALCKEVVTHHGGRIWLSSEVGRGTRVSFTLRSQPVAAP